MATEQLKQISDMEYADGVLSFPRIDGATKYCLWIERTEMETLDGKLTEKELRFLVFPHDAFFPQENEPKVVIPLARLSRNTKTKDSTLAFIAGTYVCTITAVNGDAQKSSELAYKKFTVPAADVAMINEARAQYLPVPPPKSQQLVESAIPSAQPAEDICAKAVKETREEIGALIKAARRMLGIWETKALAGITAMEDIGKSAAAHLTEVTDASERQQLESSEALAFSQSEWSRLLNRILEDYTLMASELVLDSRTELARQSKLADQIIAGAQAVLAKQSSAMQKQALDFEEDRLQFKLKLWKDFETMVRMIKFRSEQIEFTRVLLAGEQLRAHELNEKTAQELAKLQAKQPAPALVLVTPPPAPTPAPAPAPTPTPTPTPSQMGVPPLIIPPQPKEPAGTKERIWWPYAMTAVVVMIIIGILTTEIIAVPLLAHRNNTAHSSEAERIALATATMSANNAHQAYEAAMDRVNLEKALASMPANGNRQ